MAAVKNLGPMGGDADNLQCSDCGVIFSVIFHRNPVFDSIEFCPFCGEELDLPIDEHKDVRSGQCLG